MSFLDTFVSLRDDLGLAVNPRSGRGATPDSLLEAWAEFADRCEAGFDGHLDEYYSLLGVRSVLFAMMNDPRLIGFPEVVDVAYRTATIDRRVVAYFDFDKKVQVERSGIADGLAWYWNYFPGRVSPEFATELARYYGTAR